MIGIAGGGTIVKFARLDPAPMELVTVIGPDAAPAGTIAVRDELLTTLNEVASIPLNCTRLTPEKFEPVREMLLPFQPIEGEIDEMDGGARTLNELTLAVVPPRVVMDNAPELAPVGTTTVKVVELTILNTGAEIPSSLTALVESKFDPEMVTVVPMTPLDGLNPEIAGGGTTV